VDSNEDDSDAYIKPAKKAKLTPQSSVTHFLGKKVAASKAVAEVASKIITPRKASGETKALVPSNIGKGTGRVIGLGDDDISLDDKAESAPVVLCIAAPRQAAAAANIRKVPP